MQSTIHSSGRQQVLQSFVEPCLALSLRRNQERRSGENSMEGSLPVFALTNLGH